MKAATVNDIKQELSNLSPSRLVELCLRLAKFKKDNKELMSYWLFESGDEAGYTASVKKEMEEQFAAINQSNVYFAKKSLRKILRITAKHIRYTASKQVEVELLLHFSELLVKSGLPVFKNQVLSNIYRSQLKKAAAVIDTLHEDLQYDYRKTLNYLNDFK